MSMLNSGLFSSKTDMWATPQKFFDELDKEFHFTLDPCATPENAKCTRFFTQSENGLIQNWGGENSLLQSSLWSDNIRMGTQVLRRKQETEYKSCYAVTRKNRYSVFS